MYGCYFRQPCGSINKIYFLTCSHRICKISVLKKELSSPRNDFVAIPMPDSMSGCILSGKFAFLVHMICMGDAQEMLGRCLHWELIYKGLRVFFLSFWGPLGLKRISSLVCNTKFQQSNDCVISKISFMEEPSRSEC